MSSRVKICLISSAIALALVSPAAIACAQSADSENAPASTPWTAFLSFFHFTRPHAPRAIENRRLDIQNNQDARNQILQEREAAAQAVFHRKRDIVSGQLEYALRALGDSRDRLAAFIASSTAAGYDMASSSLALDAADAKIADANRDADAFSSIESSVEGERRFAETTAAIRSARASLETAIQTAGAGLDEATSTDN